MARFLRESRRPGRRRAWPVDRRARATRDQRRRCRTRCEGGCDGNGDADRTGHCRRQASRGVTADPDLHEPRSSRCGHRSARPDDAAEAADPGPGLLRPVGRRSRPRVLHREPQRRDQAAPEAPRHLCAAQVHLQRHDRRRVRAHVGHDRAALAARPLPGRAHATAIRARGATEHPLAAHDGGGSRAVPCDEVSGAEALLARGWRQPDSRCSTT